MDANTLSNLLAYSAQVACIAAAGTLLPLLLRIDAADVRYAYWRTLLVLCVVLPWAQGRKESLSSAPAAAGDAVALAMAETVVQGVVGSSPAIDWIALAGGVLAAGVVVRLMWLAAGLLRLQRLRTAGHVAAGCAEHDELRRLIADAEIRYVPGLSQPVTFGAWHPVVLLPDALRAHPPEIQRAVLCHELFHVQRRDWLWVLAEETVRGVLWFHPGVWWLISRVQLAREEVVDELAVLATGRRRIYIEALMAFSDDTPLAPATAFARKRHLFRRMVLISKEAVMSSRRVVLTGALMALMIASGSWYVVGAFPMIQAGGATTPRMEAGPLEKQANLITPENPIPARIDAPAALYPAEAAGTRGSVTLRVTLDAFGRVAEARPVGFELRSETSSMGYSNVTSWDLDAYFSARPAGYVTDTAGSKAVILAFVGAADTAVRRWRFDPPKEAPIAFDVKTTFSPDAPSSSTQTIPMAGVSGGIRAGGAGGRGGGVGGVMGSVSEGVSGGVAGGSAHPAMGLGLAAPLRVGGNIKAPTKTRNVNPNYPADAMAARVQGVVILEVTVDTDGSVMDARVLRSIEMLDRAAVDAVLQWQFTPTLLNGQAVPVIMTVTVNFTLHGR